jgi:hypothetical protein
MKMLNEIPTILHIIFSIAILVFFISSAKKELEVNFELLTFIKLLEINSPL